MGNYGWYGVNSGSDTHPVGQKLPNGLGLYDMSGNVHEWCWDWYAAYPSSARTDYRGPEAGSAKVWKGQCYTVSYQGMRIGVRLQYTPVQRHATAGFRLARS